MLSARLNFIRHVDEGHLFEALTRAYPNHRIYRAAYVWDLAPSQVLAEEAGGRYDRLVAFFRGAPP